MGKPNDLVERLRGSTDADARAAADEIERLARDNAYVIKEQGIYRRQRDEAIQRAERSEKELRAISRGEVLPRGVYVERATHEAMRQRAEKAEAIGLRYAIANPSTVHSRLVEVEGGWHCPSCGLFVQAPSQHCPCELERG